MASYSISFKPSVEKDLRSLPKAILGRVLSGIESLKSEPFPPPSVKLAGAQRLHRLRVGDYRVVYEVSLRTRQVIIHYVRHRRDVYRTL